MAALSFMQKINKSGNMLRMAGSEEKERKEMPTINTTIPTTTTPASTTPTTTIITAIYKQSLADQ